MLDAVFQGLVTLFQPTNFLMVSIGAILGLLLGVTPGLGALLGISVMLPVIFGLEPGAGILMLVGIHAAVMTGGVIPTILMGVPGAPTNVATLTEGYAMTQKGEGSRALGAAITSSALGGIVGVPLALVMLPMVISIVIAMGSPEMTLLVLMGLSFLAVLSGSGEAKLKNLMAGFFGILLSFVGLHDATGVYRYTFGSNYLAAGISMLIVVLGIFAIGEMFDIFLKGRAAIVTEGAAAVKRDGLIQGIKDVFHHRWLWFRCSLIGYIFGVIPGIGGTTSIFVCYALGKQTSKNPEQWGKGCVEGVIAPEAGNNASVGGSVLTSLALGIPGDSVLAIILGAFLVFGITPGKEMLTNRLDLTIMIIFGVAIANIVAAVICFPSISILAKIALVPSKYLFCILFSFIMVSAYSADREIMDMLAIIPLGILGVCMKRFGYSMATFILGFLLGSLFEHYLWLSLRIFGPLFFLSSPVSIVFTVILIVLFTFGPVKSFIIKSGMFKGNSSSV